jgi:hypothetical protein
MKLLLRSGVAALVLTALIAPSAFAQSPVKVQKAELAVPFGVAKGRLVTAGEMLIFIDEEMQDASFVVEKASVKNITEQDGVITIETARPIKDRSGERSRLSIRLLEGNGAMLTAWQKDAAMSGLTNGAAKTDAAAGSSTMDKAGTRVIQARQKRFPFGSTDGRLVITDKMVAFESGDLKRSRQWEYKDIREIKQQSPYLLEVIPYRGDSYNLELQGESLTSSDFRVLQDRVAASRVSNK